MSGGYRPRPQGRDYSGRQVLRYSESQSRGYSGSHGRGNTMRPQLFDYGHSRSAHQSSNQMIRYDDDDDDDDDDEEIIPLPEDLTRKFGKLTCELCLCTLPSVKQANMHYEGKQHEKRVVRYLEEWKSATGKEIPNCWMRLVRRRKQKARLPSGSDEKFCSVCNIVLTSAVVAEQHYAGRSHNTALKLYRGKNSSGDLKSNAASQFMCDICNVVTSCQEHLENHIRGSKHKKVLQRLKEAEFQEMYGMGDYEEEEEEEEPEAPEFNVIKSPSGDIQYECVYCTWRGHARDYEAHKEKLTHIAAVEEEAKKRELDDDDDDDDGCTDYTDVTDLFCKLCNIQLTSKKEVARHVKTRDHLGEVNLRKKQVLLSMDDPEKPVVEDEVKCDLCLMKFPSQSMYDAHLQWKRHVKKLANKMQSESKKRCELCQLDFFSENMYEAHLTTKRHRSNEQWLKKNQSKSGSTSDKSKTDSASIKSNDSKSNTDGGNDKKDDEENVESEKPELKSNESGSEKKSDLADGEGKKSETEAGKQKLSETNADKIPAESETFECEVCEISVSGKLPYEQHLISTRHILQCSIKQATVTQEPSEHFKNMKQPATSVKATTKPFFCKLCHVTSLTTYQHELHLTSKKHKDAVTKLEVLKFEPKLKMPMNFKPFIPPAAEKRPAIRAADHFGQSGKFDRTGIRETSHSSNQQICPDRPFYMQPNVGSKHAQPNPGGAIYGAPQPYGVSPNSLPARGAAASMPYVKPSVTPTAEPSRQPAAYSRNVTADHPPIRRATYSCKDCGQSFISGVDYKQHASLCKKKDRPQERKIDMPAKPSRPTVQNEQYRCEACDVEYTSYRTFLEHKASVEHEANIEHLRDFGKRLKPVRQKEKKPLEPQHWLRNEDRDKGLQSSKPFECRRCDVSFFSQQSFNRHINSAAHLRKPVTFKREIITYREEIKESSRSPDPHVRRNQHDWERREMQSERDRYSSASKRKQATSSDSDSDGMDLQPLKNTRRLYECIACNKICSTEQDYEEHLKSKKHRSKMCMYECGDCCETFSSKHDLSNHTCNIEKVGTAGRGDGGKWLQNWSTGEQAEYSGDNRQKNERSSWQSSYERDDDDYEVCKGDLLTREDQSEASLLSTFSFKRESYEIMSGSQGMSGVRY